MSGPTLNSICHDFSVQESDITNGLCSNVIIQVVDKITQNFHFISWSLRKINEPIDSVYTLPVTTYPSDISSLNYCNAILYLAKSYPSALKTIGNERIDLCLSICLLFNENIAFRNLLAVLDHGYQHPNNGFLITCCRNITDFMHFIDNRAKANISSHEALLILSECSTLRSFIIHEGLNYALIKLYDNIDSEEHKLMLLDINNTPNTLCRSANPVKLRQIFSDLLFYYTEDSKELTRIKQDLVNIFVKSITSEQHPINKVAKNKHICINSFHLCIMEAYEVLAPPSMHNHPVYILARTRITEELREIEKDTKLTEERAFNYVMGVACKNMGVRKVDIPDNIQLLIFNSWRHKVNSSKPEQETPWPLAVHDLMNLPDNKLTIADTIALNRHLQQKP